MILIIVLGGIKRILAKLVREKEGLPEPIELAWAPASKHWLKTHKKHVAVIILVLSCERKKIVKIAHLMSS